MSVSGSDLTGISDGRGYTGVVIMVILVCSGGGAFSGGDIGTIGSVGELMPC